MTIAEGIAELRAYKYSQEAYELKKECMELELMEQYLENQRFAMECAEYGETFTEGFLMESDNKEATDKITTDANNKKQNIIKRIINVIKKAFKFVWGALNKFAAKFQDMDKYSKVYAQALVYALSNNEILRESPTKNPEDKNDDDIEHEEYSNWDKCPIEGIKWRRHRISDSIELIDTETKKSITISKNVRSANSEQIKKNETDILAILEKAYTDAGMANKIKFNTISQQDAAKYDLRKINHKLTGHCNIPLNILVYCAITEYRIDVETVGDDFIPSNLDIIGELYADIAEIYTGKETDITKLNNVIDKIRVLSAGRLKNSKPYIGSIDSIQRDIEIFNKLKLDNVDATFNNGILDINDINSFNNGITLFNKMCADTIAMYTMILNYRKNAFAALRGYFAGN